MAQDKIAPKQDKDSSKSEMARRFRENPAVFIGTFFILVLVTVSFVLVPAIVPEFSRGRDFELTFGYYDRVPISFVPGNHFAQQYEMLSNHFRGTIEPGSFQYMMNIWRAAFESAAVHTAILQEMNRAGYTVPEHIVDRAIARQPWFSLAQWQRMPESSRLTIRRQTKEDLTRNLYLYDMHSLLTPAEEGLFIARMSERMRSFDFVSFPLDDYPESEFIAYAQERPELFRSIHLSRITIHSSERDARQVLGSVRDGTITFEDAARTHSQDMFADRGGDMGVRLFVDLQQEITSPADLERIINLGRGELSDVTQVAGNWAFFRVEEELTDADFSSPVVMERIRSYVRNFARGRMEDWAISVAMDFINDANEHGFEDALRVSGRQRRSFGPVPINYGNMALFPSLQFFPLPELTHSHSDQNFWRTIFSTPLNTLSQPLVQGANVLVFFPTEETETEEFMLEGIASAFSSFWLSNVIDQSIRSHFLTSDRMDDRFFRTFMSLGF